MNSLHHSNGQESPAIQHNDDAVEPLIQELQTIAKDTDESEKQRVLKSIKKMTYLFPITHEMRNRVTKTLSNLEEILGPGHPSYADLQLRRVSFENAQADTNGIVKGFL